MKLRPFRPIPRAAWLGEAAGRLRRTRRELLRQWALAELAESYRFPREWLARRLLLLGGEGERAAGLFGFCLVTDGHDPFLWVSVGEQPEALARLREALRGASSGHLGLSTDGTAEGTRCLRRRGASDECDLVPDIEPFSALARPGAVYRAPGGQRPGRSLSPISDALEGVFFEAHSHIRDIDGLHADDALDELCKVIHTKLLDEARTPPGEPYALQAGLSSTTEELAARVRRVHREAGEHGALASPLRLSAPALARVVQALAPCWLARSSADAKGRAFQRVLSPALRSAMGQYFTPLEVTSLIVNAAAPTVEDAILDPFAGAGHFLSQALDKVRAGAGGDEASVEAFARGKLHGIEKSDRMARVAMTDLRLRGEGHGNVRCADALLAFDNYADLRPGSFDLVMTNPPFGSLLGPDALARLGPFQLAEGRRSVPLEVLGLERCLQFLRPGGRLAIVLPDGVLANRAAARVRERVARWARLRAVVSLPIETFTPFGANIKTSILFLRTWREGERPEQRHDVCLLKIDNIGYDASGRRIPGADIDQTEAALCAFLRSEGW